MRWIARDGGLILVVFAALAAPAAGQQGGALPSWASEATAWPRASVNRPLAESTAAPAAWSATAMDRVEQASFTTPSDADHAAVPLGRPSGEASLTLPARNDKSPSSVAPGGLNMVLTTGGAVVLVVGLIFVLAWVVRRAAPRGSLPLPAEVVEVLGRTALAHRQQVHLVRCGRKLLLVSVTPDGAETLTEITDPVEVDRMLGLCRQSRPDSSTAAFRQMFEQYGHQGEDVSAADDGGVDLSQARGGRAGRAWEGIDG